MEAEIATNGNGIEEAVTTPSQLPEPCGWKILIALPNVEEPAASVPHAASAPFIKVLLAIS